MLRLWACGGDELVLSLFSGCPAEQLLAMTFLRPPADSPSISGVGWSGTWGFPTCHVLFPVEKTSSGPDGNLGAKHCFLGWA